MYLSKFSEVRVMGICHLVDGGVDVPHRVYEVILLDEHVIIDMKVTAILPKHP